MDETETIPTVPYVEGDTPAWAPGAEEPGRTPEEEAERARVAEEQRLEEEADAREDAGV